MKQEIPVNVHSLSQMTPGTKIEHRLSGQKFVVTANNGTRVTAVDNVVILVVNDNAHKDWICSTSDQPLNKLKVGDIISKHNTYVITHAGDYIISASRSIEVTNYREYYLIG